MVVVAIRVVEIRQKAGQLRRIAGRQNNVDRHLRAAELAHDDVGPRRDAAGDRGKPAILGCQKACRRKAGHNHDCCAVRKYSHDTSPFRPIRPSFDFKPGFPFGIPPGSGDYTVKHLDLLRSSEFISSEFKRCGPFRSWRSRGTTKARSGSTLQGLLYCGWAEMQVGWRRDLARGSGSAWWGI